MLLKPETVEVRFRVPQVVAELVLDGLADLYTLHAGRGTERLDGTPEHGYARRQERLLRGPLDPRHALVETEELLRFRVLAALPLVGLVLDQDRDLVERLAEGARDALADPPLVVRRGDLLAQ